MIMDRATGLLQAVIARNVVGWTGAVFLLCLDITAIGRPAEDFGIKITVVVTVLFVNLSGACVGPVELIT